MTDFIVSFWPDLIEQLLKVLLPAGIAVPLYLWTKRRWPLTLRMRDSTGRRHRRIRLARGTHRIRLALSARVPRQAKDYQLELLDTDWRSLWLAYRIPHTAGLVSMSNVVLQQTHGGEATGRGSPTNVQVWRSESVPCGADVIAIIDLTVTATALWNGGLRVEAMSPGETTKRVAIPMSFT